MQSKDFEWFKSNMPMLHERYGDCFLAIKNMKVLGSYKTYAEGVKETKKSVELGTFIVQKCGSNESAYTNYISSFNFAI